MSKRRRKNGSSDRFYFLGFQNHHRWWLQPWNYKMLAPWKKSYDKPRQCIKKQRHHFVDKGPYSPVVIYECECWTIKKAECRRTDVFKLWCWRRLLRVPWTARSNQSILEEINPEYHWKDWLTPDAKSLAGEDPDAGKDWGHEEKQMTEMAGWHHRLNGHEFKQTLGDDEGQGSLACYSPWSHQELDTT